MRANLNPILPEQVAEHWALVAPMIEEALPPAVGRSPLLMANILKAILAERLICWGVYKDESPAEMVALLTTEVREDAITGVRNLIIFSFYTFSPLTDLEVWKSGLETLRVYAKREGCSSLLVYTAIPELVDTLERFGWHQEFFLVEQAV